MSKKNQKIYPAKLDLKTYQVLPEFDEFGISKIFDVMMPPVVTYGKTVFTIGYKLNESDQYFLRKGSEIKCEKRLKEIHGPKWYQVTSIEENMEDIRGYYELILRIDHTKQWDDHRFWGNIPEDKVLE